MPLKEYDAIRLKAEFEGTLGDAQAISDHPKRTPGKDEVADYIQREVIEQGRWPIQMTELADETGWSRQHCSNTIIDYFEGADRRAGGPDASAGQSRREPSISGDTHTVFVRDGGVTTEVTIDIPDDVGDRASYVRGYLDAIEG